MYNEEASAQIFFDAIIPIVEGVTADYEIVCVNDGSQDGTYKILCQANTANPRIKVVDLSRNFGKELAMTAGIDYSSGAAVIPIDADLQDPPDLIVDMVAKWREGHDMVLAVRADRSSDTKLKRVSARLFYKLLRRFSETPIPENVGDFRLMDRRVVEALSQFPERTRFMKGIFASLGFKQTTISYTRPARAAGTTSWRLLPLWNFALDGIVSFTTLPLKIWSYIGFACALFAIGYLIILVGRTLIFGVDVPGYASLLSVMLFFNGLIMIGMGILGEYLARVFIEVKRRPLYLVRETLGLESAAIPAPHSRQSMPK
jgi:glycosyltransferase involved in cell wall biosynthesis